MHEDSPAEMHFPAIGVQGQQVYDVNGERGRVKGGETEK